MSTFWKTHVAVVVAVLAFLPSGRALCEPPPSTDPVVTIYASHKAYVGIGSGFIVSPDGQIDTAYHVVQGADSLIIVTAVGTYADASVVAYDPDRDLITLLLKGSAAKKFPVAKLGDIPQHLGARTGFALGNPDDKPNFAIHVTFPRDDLLPSSQWSVLSGPNHAKQYIFSPGNLNLIALDGTINHGMSGGPLVVDGVVIGVISGSEQVSGAGLGWAIPITYLSGANMIRKPTSLPDLPPLRLLTSESATLKPLKVAETKASRALFSRYMDVERVLSQLSIARDDLAKVRDDIDTCTEAIRHAPDPDHLDNDIMSFCGTSLAARMSAASGAMMDGVRKLPKSLGGYYEWMNGALQNAVPSPEDVRFGYYRQLHVVKEASEHLTEAAQQLQAIGPALATLGTRFPEQHFDDPRANAVAIFERMGNTVSGLLTVTDGTRELATRFDRFQAAASSWIDFSPNRDGPSKALVLSELNDTERSYFAGAFLGYYFAVKYTAAACQDEQAVSADTSKRIFAWNQEMFPIARRAEQLAADAGASDVISNFTGMRPAIITLVKNVGSQIYCGQLTGYYDILDPNDRIPTVLSVLTGDTVVPSSRNFLDSVGEYIGILVGRRLNTLTSNDAKGDTMMSAIEATIPKVAGAFLEQAEYSLLSLEVDECSEEYPASRQNLQEHLRQWRLGREAKLRESRSVIAELAGTASSEPVDDRFNNTDFQLSRLMAHVGKDLKEDLGLADDVGSYNKYCMSHLPTLLESKDLDKILDQYQARITFHK